MRAIVLFGAYACAAIAAAVLFIVFTAAQSDLTVTETLNDIRFAGILALAAAAYAVPIALPTIIVSEIRRLNDWKLFLFIGTVLGGLLAFAFAEIPFRWSNLIVTCPLVPLAIIATMIYWLIAWRWFPPNAEANAHVVELSQ